MSSACVDGAEASCRDQAALASTRFVVLGAGGLGCPAVLGLVAAGAERVTVVDHDHVDVTNLQRQVLYGLADHGRPKVSAAAHFAQLRRAKIDPVLRRIDGESLRDLLPPIAEPTPEPTVVLECSDSAELKFVVNDVCVERKIPLVIGGVLGWQGQITTVVPGAACFRCVFEHPPPAEISPTCGSVGVIGAAAGYVGYWLTLLALRLASTHAVGPALRTIDCRNARITELNARQRDGCPACHPHRGSTHRRKAPVSALSTQDKLTHEHRSDPHSPAQVQRRQSRDRSLRRNRTRGDR